jgi:hypothetical protein
MMAMLKLPNLSWQVQVDTVNIGGAAGDATGPRDGAGLTRLHRPV